MESDASSVEWIKGQRAKLARAKDRFVQSSAVTKGGISFVQHVASPFGRVLCLETRVPGLICAVTGDGSFVVWDQHYHLIDFERPKLDDRVSVACFCRQQNRTCTFFGGTCGFFAWHLQRLRACVAVTERGTAFMAIAQFQGVTSTSGSGRPIVSQAPYRAPADYCSLLVLLRRAPSPLTSVAKVCFVRRTAAAALAQ